MKTLFLGDGSSKIMKVGFVILIVAVLFSVFVRSPFWFHDEHLHYIRSLGISGGELLVVKEPNYNNQGMHGVDASSLDFIPKLREDDTVTAISTDWLSNDELRIAHSGNIENYRATSVAPYTPIPYISFSLGSLTAKLFNADVVTEFIFMRIFGAITALLLIFLAVRIAPKWGKWCILAIALLPMSIASFASITADSFTIGISLLFVSYFAHIVETLLHRGKLKRFKSIVPLLVLAIGVSFAKMPTFFLVTLLPIMAVVFWKRLRKPERIALLVTTLICVAITILWLLYAKDFNTGAYWGRDVDTIGQLKFILHNPAIFLANLLGSIFSYDFSSITFNTYANDAVFSRIPVSVSVIMIISLVAAAFSESRNSTTQLKLESVKMAKRITASQIILFALIVISIFSILYLQFTPIGTQFGIDGVQQRYFIPFLPLLLLIPIIKQPIQRKIPRIFSRVMPCIGVAIYVAFVIIQLTT